MGSAEISRESIARVCAPVPQFARGHTVGTLSCSDGVGCRAADVCGATAGMFTLLSPILSLPGAVRSKRRDQRFGTVSSFRVLCTQAPSAACEVQRAIAPSTRGKQLPAGYLRVPSWAMRGDLDSCRYSSYLRKMTIGGNGRWGGWWKFAYFWRDCGATRDRTTTGRLSH